MRRHSSLCGAPLHNAYGPLAGTCPMSCVNEAMMLVESITLLAGHTLTVHAVPLHCNCSPFGGSLSDYIGHYNTPAATRARAWNCAHRTTIQTSSPPRPGRPIQRHARLAGLINEYRQTA